jgi:hypothetical protein
VFVGDPSSAIQRSLVIGRWSFVIGHFMWYTISEKYLEE